MYKAEKCDVRAELLFCVLNVSLFCRSRYRLVVGFGVRFGAGTVLHQNAPWEEL